MGCPTCYETTSPEIVPVTVNQTTININESPAMFRIEYFSYGDSFDNKSFALGYLPYEPKSVQVYLNSGAQRYNTDYQVQGQTLVLATALESGDNIQVNYVSVSGIVSSSSVPVGVLVGSAGVSLTGFLRMDNGVVTHSWTDYPALRNWFWEDDGDVSAGLLNPADTAEPGASRRSDLLKVGYDGTNFELILLQDTSYDGTELVTTNKFISLG